MSEWTGWNDGQTDMGPASHAALGHVVKYLNFVSFKFCELKIM